MTSDVAKVRTLDWAVVGAGVVAYLSSLLPWYSASITILSITRSASVNAWNAGFGAWFAVLLLVVAAIVVLVSALGGLRLPASRPLITLGLAALAFITILVRWATFPDAGGGLGSGKPSSDGLGELGNFDLGSAFTVSSGAGAGLYLGLIAAITAVAASLLAFRATGSNFGS